MTLCGSPLIRVMKAPPKTVDRKRPCHLGGFATVHVGVDLSVGEVGEGDDCLPDAGLLAQLSLRNDRDVMAAHQHTLVTAHPTPPLPGTFGSVRFAEDAPIKIEDGIAGHHDCPIGRVSRAPDSMTE